MYNLYRKATSQFLITSALIASLIS